MKKVLVTGAYGFLGRFTSLAFKQKGFEVTGMGHGHWESFEYSKWGIDKWFESTITFESLRNIGRCDFDVIVHCGGSSSVGFSFQNPYEDFQKSIQSTLALLEFIRLEGRGTHFIYPSSPAVLGNLGDRPIGEDEPHNPISPYGFHKKIAEDLCRSYHQCFQVNVSVIRFFSIYGAGLRKQLLWDACRKISQNPERVEFFGTGEETRDWIHVTDAASLIYFLSEIKGGFQVYNGAGGEKTTVREVLKMLCDAYGKEIDLVFSNKIKAGDPRFYHADVSTTRALGWAPEMELSRGIADYVGYFKAQQHG